MIFDRLCRLLILTCMQMTQVSFVNSQRKEVTEIENVLNKEFANVCHWLVDNKLSIHFGEDKTRCFFVSRDMNRA